MTTSSDPTIIKLLIVIISIFIICYAGKASIKDNAINFVRPYTALFLSMTFVLLSFADIGGFRDQLIAITYLIAFACALFDK